MAQLAGGAAAAGAFRFTRAHEYGLEWADEPSMRLRMNMACEFIGIIYLHGYAHIYLHAYTHTQHT